MTATLIVGAPGFPSPQQTPPLTAPDRFLAAHVAAARRSAQRQPVTEWSHLMGRSHKQSGIKEVAHYGRDIVKAASTAEWAPTAVISAL
jgi:hypothetical protein